MTQDPGMRVKRGRIELTLEQMAAVLPTPEDQMFAIGQAWGTAWHAVRGGNWQLAAHAANHVRKVLGQYAILNPNDAPRIEAFRPLVDAVVAAARARDAAAFDTAFAAATDEANLSHTETGHAFIVWKVPSEPPTYLELGPIKPSDAQR